jgi:cysteine-rich repeat protein
MVASGHTCCDRGRVNDVSLLRFLGNPAVCGNGLTEFPELCDDGNLSNEDGCDSNCTPGRCGNRIVTSGEICDEGSATPTCDADCTPVTCGDGLRNLAAGEECDDGNLDDGDGCTATCAIDCPLVPLTGCRHPGKSQILLKRGGPPASRKLGWIWKQGDEIGFAELGDPATDTEYRLCLYDTVGGAPVRVLTAGVPPGGDCGRGPCWQPTNRRQRYWSPIGADGVKILTLTSGPAGKSRMQVQASGAELDAPMLPLAIEPALVAQLVNDAGVCWESVFPADGVRQNADIQFKASSN